MKNKNHIIESVQKQLFRYGIKSLNMDDIAYQLGISKKTLYQVVGNKESMVELTTENFVAEQQTVIEGICQQSKDNIRELIALTLHISEVSGQFSDSMIYDLKKVGMER